MDNKLLLDLTEVPKELSLILELLKGFNDDDFSETNLELFIDIDWDLFIGLTKHHRLYPLLYRKLKAIDGDVVPSYVTDSLHQQYKRNTFQMLHLSAEMEHVSKLFSNDQIRPLFLKGPALAHELYGDISHRTSSDLDILIHIEELDKADNVLTKLGYEKDEYIETVLNDWKWRHHHVTYFHSQKNIKLEIHWRLNPGPAKEPSFNELWGRKEKSSLTNNPVYLLGKEDLFLFLISHGARHGWSRLRWLLDIHQLINQEMNWGNIHSLLKANHYIHVGGQGIILASQLLNTNITNQMKPLLVSNRSKNLAQQAIFYLKSMVNLHTDPVPEKVASYHKRHLFSLMSTQQKLFFIISFLYPYPADAKTFPLPKQLHFLYFPLRPLLCAWRKTRRHALPLGGK